MSDQQTVPQFIGPEVRREAEELIGRLAFAAGDQEAVYEALRSYCRGRKVEDAFAVTAAALLLVFSDYIATPTH